MHTKLFVMRKNMLLNWNINPDCIGIMGFSAGGHLASTVATHASEELRPAFQILFYPVISMEPKYGHGGSCRQFLGEKATEELKKDLVMSIRWIRLHQERL